MGIPILEHIFVLNRTPDFAYEYDIVVRNYARFQLVLLKVMMIMAIRMILFSITTGKTALGTQSLSSWALLVQFTASNVLYGMSWQP